MEVVLEIVINISMETHVNYLVQKTALNVTKRLGFAAKDVWRGFGGNDVMNYVIQVARTIHADKMDNASMGV